MTDPFPGQYIGHRYSGDRPSN